MKIVVKEFWLTCAPGGAGRSFDFHIEVDEKMEYVSGHYFYPSPYRNDAVYCLYNKDGNYSATFDNDVWGMTLDSSYLDGLSQAEVGEKHSASYIKARDELFIENAHWLIKKLIAKHYGVNKENIEVVIPNEVLLIKMI